MRIVSHAAAFLLLLITAAAFAETAPQAAAPVTGDDPTALIDARDKLTRRQDALMKETADLADELNSLMGPFEAITDFDDMIRRQDSEIARIEARLAAPNAEPENLALAEAELADAKQYNDRNKASRTRATELSLKLEANRKERTDIVDQLYAIDRRIAALLNFKKDENSFRQMVSYAFIVLVALVIGGFYWIAMKFPTIAENIFSGEMGIQFITLFLIVIAIILFGIMSILESRELSALLGGISGFILGRVSKQAQSATNG
jgi:hypothetical protein